jgi:hypothetical protein
MQPAERCALPAANSSRSVTRASYGSSIFHGRAWMPHKLSLRGRLVLPNLTISVVCSAINARPYHLSNRTRNDHSTASDAGCGLILGTIGGPLFYCEHSRFAHNPPPSSLTASSCERFSSPVAMSWFFLGRAADQWFSSGTSAVPFAVSFSQPDLILDYDRMGIR